MTTSYPLSDLYPPEKMLRERNAMGFLMATGDNTLALRYVQEHLNMVIDHDMLESTLFHAVIGTRTNHYHDREILDDLMQRCDKAKMRQAGDPLPAGERFTIYRGVSGADQHESEPGWSWTLSARTAAWFALRFDFGRPTVYVAEISADEIYSYSDDREEQDVTCRPDKIRVYADRLEDIQALRDE